MKASGVICCVITSILIGFLIFFVTSNTNAGLPASTRMYNLVVTQTFSDKLMKMKTGSIELTPSRTAHEKTLIWLHDIN